MRKFKIEFSKQLFTAGDSHTKIILLQYNSFQPTTYPILKNYSLKLFQSCFDSFSRLDKKGMQIPNFLLTLDKQKN